MGGAMLVNPSELSSVCSIGDAECAERLPGQFSCPQAKPVPCLREKLWLDMPQVRVLRECGRARARHGIRPQRRHTVKQDFQDRSLGNWILWLHSLHHSARPAAGQADHFSNLKLLVNSFLV